MSAAGGGGVDQQSSIDPSIVKSILSKSKSLSNATPNSYDISPGGQQSDQVKKGQELAARGAMAARAMAARAMAAKNDPSVSIAPKAVEGEGGGGAATGDFSPISVVESSERKIQGINTVARNELISATGREFGPDIALKVGPNIVDTKIVDKEIEGIINKIINKESSITEVLNILAFLLNNDDERKNKNSVITDFSYGNEEKFKAVYVSFKDSAPPLFDIKKLTLTSSAAGVSGAPINPTDSITIPGTILKRDELYDLKNDIKITSDQIRPLISACILQMVNILENTRQVFGGWAKLFKGMQGGSNSKSKTKTRRNNRRRH